LTLGWPRFEIATFEKSDSVPHDVQALLRKAGVPKGLFGSFYAATAILTPVEIGTHGLLILFGRTGLFGGIYLDPKTGEILAILDPAQHPGALPQFVNSTPGQFTNTVKAVIDLFPFYDRDSDLEERKAAADKVAEAIRSIDPAALGHDSFWGTFNDDLVTGDFATQDIVGDDG
jgi:hypothetical protein